MSICGLDRLTSFHAAFLLVGLYLYQNCGLRMCLVTRKQKSFDFWFMTAHLEPWFKISYFLHNGNLLSRLAKHGSVCGLKPRLLINSSSRKSSEMKNSPKMARNRNHNKFTVKLLCYPNFQIWFTVNMLHFVHVFTCIFSHTCFLDEHVVLLLCFLSSLRLGYTCLIMWQCWILFYIHILMKFKKIKYVPATLSSMINQSNSNNSLNFERVIIADC